MVNECMGRTAHATPTKAHQVKAAKLQKKTQPATTGQSEK